MTTDKPKWWQTWIVYGLVGLVLMVVPYMGTYVFLSSHLIGYGYLPISDHELTYHTRIFRHGALGKIFAPLGWAEAKYRGEVVEFQSPSEEKYYVPGW